MKIVNRLVSWMGNGVNYWLLIVPLAITIAAAFFLKKYTWGLDAFRLIGIVIEISGLLTVVLSLSRESKKYNHTGYFRSLLSWVADFKHIFIVRNAVAELSGVGCAGVVFGAAGVGSNLNFNTVEEKIDYLLKRVVELQGAIDEGLRYTERVRNELSEHIAEVKSKITDEIVVIQNELKEKATLDYYMLISGAWLTGIGMIMTNVPDGIFKKLLFC